MKKIITLLALLAASLTYGQNVGIGTNQPLSKLHVAGDLRVESLARKDSGVVLHSSEGVLQSLQLTGKSTDVFRGDGTFGAVVAADASWLTTGNAGTAGTNFLGTTDAQPLRFRVNNQSAGILAAVGNNVAFGLHALRANTTGEGNTALGAWSLGSNTTGEYNTATGTYALFTNTAGEYNTANGYKALFSNTTGEYNTAVGYYALFANTTASYNTAVGFQALWANTKGLYNTSSGYKTLMQNTTGFYNSAFGHRALTANTTGSYNTAVGYRTLFRTTTAQFNTGAGYRVLYNTTTGERNAGFGYQALLGNTTGSGNTGLGHHADVTVGNLTNATAIGFNAKVNASNKVRIGNSAVTTIEGQVPFTTPSDGRYKFNVRDDVAGLDFILRLHPVTYQFDVSRFDGWTTIPAAYQSAQSLRRSGFIAQEVEKAATDACYNFSGVVAPQNEQEHYSLSYESFVVPLVKAVQEQQETIRQQQVEIDELRTMVKMLMRIRPQK